MIFHPKEITLKNGKKAILKTPEISDAAGMLAYIKKACGETDLLLRTPEEWEAVTLEKEEKWVKNQRESKNTLAITCFIDGEIAGNCEISFRSGTKTRHRAVVGIAILQKFWNLGIGTAMMQYLEELARQIGYEQIELEVVDGNDTAKRLYEKCGFVETGKQARALKYDDGTYRDEILMIKVL